MNLYFTKILTNDILNNVTKIINKNELYYIYTELKLNNIFLKNI